MNFPFETNGKLMILGVPILKHFRVKFRAQLFKTNELLVKEALVKERCCKYVVG